MATAILQQATTAELGNAVPENLFDLFRAMTTLPGSELDEAGAVARHFSFPTNPMFKGVWRNRIPPNRVDEVIDATIDWFKIRNAPYFFWWVAPGDEPADLGAQLEARGLLSMEGQQRVLAPGIKQTAAGAPVMATDLRAIVDDALLRTPPGYAIEEVGDQASLDEFKRVFVESYEIPEWAGQAWVDATLRFGIGKSPWRMFVGRLDGRAVATNMLFNGGGVASVYAVATLAEARGKGIGAAITLAPLLIARDAGYRYAVLFTTEMGVSVYHRIGFRDCGVRLNRYLWRAS